MTSSNILYKGIDLDLVYENPRQGAAHANVNFLTQVSAPTGDISLRYTDLAATTKANGNLATRVPPTTILTTTGTDLSDIFAGNIAQYGLTQLYTNHSTTTLNIGSVTTLTHQFTITWASAQALIDYFKYGGRIVIAPSNVGSFTVNTADWRLQEMFNNIGTMIFLDSTNAANLGHYITGGGANITVNNPTVGGRNLGTTSQLLLTAVDAGFYTVGNGYTITAVANSSAGSATQIQFTCVITLTQAGSVADSYAGQRTSVITQRNYGGYVPPTQAVPGYTTNLFNW